MNISQISPQTFTATVPKRKLVPISKYKGEFLRLTEEDNAKIDQIRKEIQNLEMEHYDLNKIISFSKCISRGLMDKLYFIEQCIESLNAQIKDIKAERLKQQMAAAI